LHKYNFYDKHYFEGLALHCFNCSLTEQSRCARSQNLPRPVITNLFQLLPFLHSNFFVKVCPEPFNLTAEEAKAIGAKAVCIKTTKPCMKVQIDKAINYPQQLFL
jgi:hypothetical protein